MPHLAFNPDFLRVFVPPEVTRAEIMSIYGGQEDPIYFVPGDGDTADQLRAFKLHPEFENFKRQYEKLLHGLNDWCLQQGIQQLYFPDIPLDAEVVADEGATAVEVAEEEPIPAFDLFKLHLFGEYDFYSLRAVILFKEGKQALEELLLLLWNDDVPLDKKRSVLESLQASITLCSDGVLTNITDAKSDLLAYTGVFCTIQNTKRNIMQQFALDIIKSMYPDIDAGYEIHFANSFVNYVAHTYGVLPYDESYAHSLGIDIEQLDCFSDIMEREFSPEIVLNALVEVVAGEFQAFLAKINTTFFDGTSIRKMSQDGSDAGDFMSINELIAKWKSRYDPLFSFTTNDIFQEKDEQGLYVLAPYNAAFVHAKVACGFNRMFLRESQEYVFRPEGASETSLVFNTGFYWVNQQDTIHACTPDIFVTMRAPATDSPERLAHCLILQDLMLTFPDSSQQLLAFIAQAEDILLWLMESGFDAIATALLNSEFCTISHLTARKQTGVNAGINALWLIASDLKFDLIKKLFKSGRLTSEQFTAAPLGGEHVGKNVFWFLAVQDQFDLIEELAPLITSDHLGLAPQTGQDENINFLWFLASRQKFPLIRRLFADRSLRPDHVSAISKSEGVNVIWYLAIWREFDLLDAFLTKNLITPESLLAKTQTAGSLSGNVLLLLASQEQFLLIRRFLAKNLITPESLAQTFQGGKYAGANTLWFLAFYKQFSLIEDLFIAECLIPEQVMALPQVEEGMGMSILRLLVDNQQFSLVQKLFRRGFFTSEQLGDAPKSGERKGKNSVWVLAFMKQVFLLDELLIARRITSAHLAARSQVGDYAGTNALWHLANSQQFNFIQKLFAARVLTSAQLDASPQIDGVESGETVLWILASKRQFTLIRKFAIAGLITLEQLEKTYRGVSVRDLLEIDRQFPLLDYLRGKRLIPPAPVAFPTSDSLYGAFRTPALQFLGVFSDRKSTPQQQSQDDSCVVYRG